MHRIEVVSKIPDTKAQLKKTNLESTLGRKIGDVELVDVYTIDADLHDEEAERVSFMLTNPVFQDAKTKVHIPSSFEYALEIGFLPGVTNESMRVLGMMPHPERAIDFTHLPNWTLLKEKYKRFGTKIPNEGPGLQIFKNGVNYFS